jgi:hypothetical protein
MMQKSSVPGAGWISVPVFARMRGAAAQGWDEASCAAQVVNYERMYNVLSGPSGLGIPIGLSVHHARFWHLV